MTTQHSAIKVTDILLLPVFYTLSGMPFWLLYRLSDLLFLIVYYGVGYRKLVTRENLLHSFPDKSDAQRKEIEKKYYAYLCDLILESFKTMTISRKAMLKRCSMSESSIQLFSGLQLENKSAILVLWAITVIGSGLEIRWEFCASNHFILYSKASLS